MGRAKRNTSDQDQWPLRRQDLNSWDIFCLTSMNEIRCNDRSCPWYPWAMAMIFLSATAMWMRRAPPARMLSIREELPTQRLLPASVDVTQDKPQAVCRWYHIFSNVTASWGRPSHLSQAYSTPSLPLRHSKLIAMDENNTRNYKRLHK